MALPLPDLKHEILKITMFWRLFSMQTQVKHKETGTDLVGSLDKINHQQSPIFVSEEEDTRK
jgi:hypothetical protein